jgi:hypothetical protein
MYIPSIRKALSRAEDTANLGFIANLSGTWEGVGFNLIARPDKQGNSPLFLELNQTFETLSVIPIASTIPNRGNQTDDVSLFGLTYLQKVTDLTTKGALHIEPGIWIHVPSQDQGETQSVARMGTIPHGNSMLATGTAIELDPFNGNPFDPNTVSAANTAPFPVGSPMPQPGTLGGFPPYDLSNSSDAAIGFRTPAGDNPATPLPSTILGVPTLLLTAALRGQTIRKMVVINVATAASFAVAQPPIDGQPQEPTAKLFNGGGGGVENILFLQDNADVATVFATFWIETIAGATPEEDFLQMQYVQTVLLNFPLLVPGNPAVPLSWPHVSVATLHKTFGGQ